MKKYFFSIVLLINSIVSAQTDFSDSWEDFFSYNNVKDFIKVDSKIYALADNAVFIYDIENQDTQKLSSVNGLSGETTTSIYFSQSTNKLIIGYANGLIEVVDSEGDITISPDIVSFNQFGEKSINDIFEYQDKIYLSTSFAIVEYDINELEFGDTFFIGNNSSDLVINEIEVFNDLIYAATNEGVFYADVNNSNLIDFNNWNSIQLSNNNFKKITAFNNKLFTVLNNQLYEITNTNSLQLRLNFFQTINGVKESLTNLTVAFNDAVTVYDLNLNPILQNNADVNFEYTLNNAFAENNTLYLGTNQFGILQSTFLDVSNFTEIHPDGPISNDVFSVSAQNNNLWAVYGGYSLSFPGPFQRKLGYSHFNGEVWLNTQNDNTNPFPDFVDVTLDPNNDSKAFISSLGDTNLVDTFNTGGLFEIENNEITNFYNSLNSPLQDITEADPNRITVRVTGSVFDRTGDLWVTNFGVSNELKKLSNGSWSSFDISSVKTQNSFGLTDITSDRNNTIWIGTRGDGVIAYNENGNRIRALTASQTQGSLPNLRVMSLAVDSDNRIWIGTISGLVVFNNASGVFDSDIIDAQPIIILDNGIARRLLGDEVVNTIAVDGANNKWFGTDNAGVTYTNPNGQNTLANFSSENSPLPSNRIMKIAVDNSNGKVYFATDKGIVAYNSNVEPFGDTLGEVYAYPNPVRKFHNNVTITGRDGTNLPKGTNVKIVDVAGNLVFETNVVEGQQLQGGKVVWDKTNLAGTKVASGVYIVLLANEDATETSTAKIAIIN